VKSAPLAIYFALLAVISAAFIAAAKMLGQRGAFLAQGYMLTPAVAALITRRFFYAPGFKDANLRLGKVGDYVRFWIASIGISALSYVLFTVLGGITWDFSGQVFLDRLAAQFAATGRDITASLPAGFTPQMMLIVFFVGGLTVFNIVPGVIAGFGEEFGHRGFMFPALYRIRPWAGFLIGGLVWYAWHMPLALVVPKTADYPLWQDALNHGLLAVGSVCTFVYLAYVYVRTGSVWVTSVAHITMNNSAGSFSYFAVIENQVLANAGLTLAMVTVVATLHYTKRLRVFGEYFSLDRDKTAG